MGTDRTNDLTNGREIQMPDAGCSWPRHDRHRVGVLHRLDVARVLVVVGAVSSAVQSFQWPAYETATTLLVPKERYSQASGMVSMAEAPGQLVAPFLGGVLIAVGGVATLLVVDAVTFTFAIVTLLIVRFPRPPKSKVGEESEGSLWQESLFGFRYVWAGHGLFFVAIGLYTVIMAMLSWLYGPLRNLEHDIPDAAELPEPAEVVKARSQEIDVAQDPVSG